MKLNIYSLFDRLSGESRLVFTSKNDELTKRTVAQCLVSQQPNAFNQDVDDLDIFQVGSFDTTTQVLAYEPVNRFCFRVSDVIAELKARVAAEEHEKELVEKLKGEKINECNETN